MLERVRFDYNISWNSNELLVTVKNSVDFLRYFTNHSFVKWSICLWFHKIYYAQNYQFQKMQQNRINTSFPAQFL